MKKTAIIFCSLMVLLVGLTVSAAAQATQYRVDVPFDFNVGNKSFEAGEYVVKLDGQNKEFLTIQSENGKTNFIQIVSKTTRNIDFSKLVFNRYENEYFLAEIISPTINAKIGEGNSEKRLADKQKSKRETVAMK